MPEKPLGIKAYGHIAHLPGSRMGPSDHHCHEGQARICCERARDRRDQIIVQEKLDGSCCAVAKVNGDVVALGRAGYLAASSPYEQHHLFARWVETNRHRFHASLNEGERVVGEWLAQAHGTRYELRHEPFVAFDIIVGTARLPYDYFAPRVQSQGFAVPNLLHRGGPLSIEEALSRLEKSEHGAIDPVEGAVWRVERDDPRKGVLVDFLAKYVRPDKVDGCYLPNVSGGECVWNWSPQ